MNSGVINLELIMKNPAAHCRVSTYNGHSLLSLRGALRLLRINSATKQSDTKCHSERSEESQLVCFTEFTLSEANVFAMTMETL